MLHIPEVLTGAALARVIALIAGARWVDGLATAGHLSAQVKRNQQLAEDDPAGLEASSLIFDALAVHPVFASSALAAKISPPLFNRYDVGETYGPHIDGAIRPLGSQRMRTDLSATLFLSDPNSYDGGELRIADVAGEHIAKFAAGDLFLYPSGAIHHVAPVNKGTRIASFFWVQSLVREDTCRRILFDLDSTIQSIASGDGQSAHVLQLTAVYHNLLRLWSDV